MTRLAIIDHATHTLFIEDVSEEDLARYGGEEEAYIRVREPTASAVG